jgi:MYXO-CTERM domain-containing protein
VAGSGTGGSGEGGSGTGGSAPVSAEPADEGGCGCRLEAAASPSPRWLALGLLSLGLVGCSRRRPRKRG